MTPHGTGVPQPQDAANSQSGHQSAGPEGPPETDLEKAPISDVLEHFITSWPHDRISLGDIVDGLGTRSFGLILLMLALPNLFPIYIPGLSAVLGLPMVIVTYQMMRRHKHVGLPKSIRTRSLTISDFRRAMNFVIPKMRFVERFLRPRFEEITGPDYERLLGCLVFGFAVVVLFPFPFTNLLPSAGISLIALGILERDGVSIAIGTVVGFVGAILAAIFSVAIFRFIWGLVVSLFT